MAVILCFGQPRRCAVHGTAGSKSSFTRAFQRRCPAVLHAACAGEHKPSSRCVAVSQHTMSRKRANYQDTSTSERGKSWDKITDS